jgi:hypothetical protein
MEKVRALRLEVENARAILNNSGSSDIIDVTSDLTDEMN